MAEFLDFMDRFDGGGANSTGNRFEGGGLLSLIGNALMRPAGYADRQADIEKARLRERMAASSQAEAQTPTQSTQSAQLSPFEMFDGQPPAQYSPPQLSPFEMFDGQPPAQYSPPQQSPPQQSPPQQSPSQMFGGQRPASYDGQFGDIAPTFEQFKASLGAAGQNIPFMDLLDEYFLRLGQR